MKTSQFLDLYVIIELATEMQCHDHVDTWNHIQRAISSRLGKEDKALITAD